MASMDVGSSAARMRTPLRKCSLNGTIRDGCGEDQVGRRDGNVSAETITDELGQSSNTET